MVLLCGCRMLMGFSTIASAMIKDSASDEGRLDGFDNCKLDGRRGHKGVWNGDEELKLCVMSGWC